MHRCVLFLERLRLIDLVVLDFWRSDEVFRIFGMLKDFFVVSFDQVMKLVI